MKIQEVLKQAEGKTLEFKKEIPKNRQNFFKNSGRLCKWRRRTEIGSQRTEIGSQRTEIGSQRSEIGSRIWKQNR